MKPEIKYQGMEIEIGKTAPFDFPREMPYRVVRQDNDGKKIARVQFKIITPKEDKYIRTHPGYYTYTPDEGFTRIVRKYDEKINECPTCGHENYVSELISEKVYKIGKIK